MGGFATFSRRALLLGSGAAGGWLAARRLTGDLPDIAGVARAGGETGELILNDASGLSPTPVRSHSVLTAHGDPLIDTLRAELALAREEGRGVNIGAARHSMGGQAIPRDGRAITLDHTAIEPDTAAGTYRVAAGARWSDVIAALDAIGFSPPVMQSNHDFGIAATFSVNAHGWPVPYGPMGATVRSLRMVLPDGSLVTASRSENAELFGLAMGGYGLIGLIVDLEVDMVPNLRLEPTYTPMPAAEFPEAFLAAINSGEVPMAYGRLNVDRERLFEDALLVTYRPTEDQADLPAARGSGTLSRMASRIYRAQTGNERMKRLRWWVETDLGPRFGGESTRNTLMNEPVVTLDDRDPTRTDILHEYFIAPDRFGDFLTACRAVIPNAFAEFLNVTLRYVAADPDSVLAYARVPRIAAVMSFSQEMTARAEADHARMTRELIDYMTEIGGSYYLPYRPHPTPEQFTRAYPRAAEFAEAKRALDPDLVLRNNLWDSYLGVL